tara:strand:- start:6080 stop:7867 length:1788 start_codon:yes stop_codon:yes gene_type:complete
MAYGYVRDKEPLNINWSEVSKNFSDNLKEQEKVRQDKRDDIQEQYSELTKSLIDRPQGANSDLNTVIGSYSDQASQAALANLNKLKRGEISEREYYTRRANMKSSTENFFLYADKFNTQLAENMELVQSQDPDKQASGRMINQLSIAQEFLNFKNTTAIIDPATDELILVRTDEDGNPTDEVIDVTQLGYLSTEKELAFNYRGDIQKRLANRGIKQYTEDGKIITTIQGAKINSLTATGTIDTLAKSLVTSEANALSVLDQNGYKYTSDEKLYNDNLADKNSTDKYIFYDMKNNKYLYDQDAAEAIVKAEITSQIPVEQKDEISAFQKRTLANVDRAFNQGVKEYDQNFALLQQKQLAENGLTATNINSATNEIIPANGGDPISAVNYIRTINEDSFDTKANKNDVATNLDEVLKTVDIDNAEITFKDGGEFKVPMDKDGKGIKRIRDIAMAPGKYSPGTLVSTATKAALLLFPEQINEAIADGLSFIPVNSFPTVDIKIPGMTTEPIRVPVNAKTSEYLEEIMVAIGNAKKLGTQVDPSSFDFIVNNEFYNPGIEKQEETIEEEVVVDTPDTIVDEEVVVDSEPASVDGSKYND